MWAFYFWLTLWVWTVGMWEGWEAEWEWCIWMRRLHGVKWLILTTCLLILLIPWEIYEFVCVHLRKSLRGHVCLHCVIITSLFFFPLTALTCHHRSRRVSASEHSCTSVTLCFRSASAFIKKRPGTTGCKIRWASGHVPLAFRSLTVSVLKISVVLNLLSVITITATHFIPPYIQNIPGFITSWRYASGLWQRAWSFD